MCEGWEVGAGWQPALHTREWQCSRINRAQIKTEKRRFYPFAIHSYFLRRGREEFRSPVSLFILWATLAVSLVQGVLTAILLVG
jgi:hypothetical protein